MLLNGLVLATLTTTCFLVVWKKLPRKIRRFIQKQTLLCDAIALLLTYILLGGTLTALVAAAMVGLMVSGLLHIANNEQDFVFLHDYCKIVKEKLAQLKVILKEFNDGHVAKKEAIIE